ncbi:uncharacterized protein LOC132720568 isoform X2 [Ruditapes philippinarum]|uniref:uncharacterized protein LOC132720568 isoform X2 n=1 Tax=Ruditapes philippinarum TaxID=129788 RepID=UPI00295BE37B|nr:uncharacterized protein LOC132720568 isoform X2 [Ruditapes philippinarum]
MATMERFVFVVGIILLAGVRLCTAQEPNCGSNFGCNYEILQKILLLEQEITDLKIDNRRQQKIIDRMDVDDRGSTYVRWGRNVCPDDASLIYKGFVGGKYYNEAGSGSDSICLPEDPTWSNYTDGDAKCCRGRIYGSEFHIEEPNGIFPYGIHSQDAPCAVCESKKSTILMIPARSNCYPGWKLEYSGYLMANYKGHAGPHNHICVDNHPEFILNGGAYNLQHILYLMEAQCGSLPCPPYVQGRELACVVCSK